MADPIAPVVAAGKVASRLPDESRPVVSDMGERFGIVYALYRILWEKRSRVNEETAFHDYPHPGYPIPLQVAPCKGPLDMEGYLVGFPFRACIRHNCFGQYRPPVRIVGQKGPYAESASRAGKEAKNVIQGAIFRESNPLLYPRLCSRVDQNLLALL